MSIDLRDYFYNVRNNPDKNAQAQPFDAPGITPDSAAFAKKLQDLFDAQIGGSYLVLGVHAKDVDVFMTQQEFMNKVEPWLYENNIEYTVNDAGAKLYSEDGGYALDGVYNIGQVQIILVKPMFVGAYKRCAQIMSTYPAIFNKKEDRVALHRILRYLVTIGE